MKRFRRWFLVALVCYVGVYLVISRIALWRNRQSGIDGFYYVPVRPERFSSPVYESLHRVGCIVFLPVHVIDSWLGGPHITSIPLFRLE